MINVDNRIDSISPDEPIVILYTDSNTKLGESGQITVSLEFLIDPSDAEAQVESSIAIVNTQMYEFGDGSTSFNFIDTIAANNEVQRMRPGFTIKNLDDTGLPIQLKVTTADAGTPDNKLSSVTSLSVILKKKIS